LEALKEAYDLTLFTVVGLNLEILDVMYSTNLINYSIRTQTLFPRSLNYLLNWIIANNAPLRKILIHRLLFFFKQQGQDYDLLISAYNAADLGCPGMQYIHWVKVVEGGKYYKYNRISQFAMDGLKSNFSWANSHFVAQKIQKTYGIESQVIYPPVVIKSSDIPWTAKEEAFICSGRLIEAKSPHRIIEILKQVRAQGFKVKLYLTGGGGGIYALQYQRFLAQLIKSNQDWVILCKNLSYEDYTKVLYRCKYGIHFKQEPFGISIAEMLKAGALPFVRNQGGQVEIVGSDHNNLLFENDQDAVAKITHVLSNPSEQLKLVEALKSRQELFSTQKFTTQISQSVAEYLSL
jgi:glycosyltransferase involved in cell wall biosynthesis